MFIRDLTEHATQRQFVYAHSWCRLDLVMWDNRVTMHRARRYNHTEVRDMRRTTVACETDGEHSLRSRTRHPPIESRNNMPKADNKAARAHNQHGSIRASSRSRVSRHR